jgi:conjugal transfer pilus assembly protein TraL
MADKYAIPARLDDPELIGLWTLDEFIAMVLPFIWGVLTQHILIGIILGFGCWWGLRKAKAGRAASWLLHLCQRRSDSRPAGRSKSRPLLMRA